MVCVTHFVLYLLEAFLITFGKLTMAVYSNHLTVPHLHVASVISCPGWLLTNFCWIFPKPNSFSQEHFNNFETLIVPYLFIRVDFSLITLNVNGVLIIIIIEFTASFTCHVKAVLRSVHFRIQNIRRNWFDSPKAVSVSLANALVASRLDYCNSFIDTTGTDFRKLPMSQNYLVRTIA